MTRPLPPAARMRDAIPFRCPGCGSGDLFMIEVVRREGNAWRGAYCAGEYDRDRRRFVRRSCGYSGAVVEIAIDRPESQDLALRSAG